MCLAIPGRIESIGEDRIAEVSILGIKRSISIDLVPTVAIGDFVLVHAGFAIEIVDEVFANETIELIKQFPELAEA
jgi:hydrogenase expression/formation protein HypC